MGKRREAEPKSVEEIKVKLKPVLGIKPGIYLTVFYGIIVLVVLWALLFLPGMSKNGSVTSLISHPAHAAVYIDGAYAGTTPCSVFIPKGKHVILFKKPFFTTREVNQHIPGKIFASLLIPSKVKLEEVLTIEDFHGLLAWVYQELSEWALIERVHSGYQVPPLLIDLVKDLYSLDASVSEKQAYEALLIAAARNISNEFLLRDYIKAFSLFDSKDTVLTPGSLTASIRRALKMKDTYRNAPFWFFSILSLDMQKKLEANRWFKDFAAAYLDGLNTFTAVNQSPKPDISKINFLGLTFSKVPGGKYIMGTDSKRGDMNILSKGIELPHEVIVDSFYMLNMEVTQEQFLRFLDSVPEWKPENRKVLLEKGLVSEDYLADWDPKVKGAMPVAFVSYYAAKAYCEWLNLSLPPEMGQYEVRLPKEEEWEYAAQLDLDYTGAVLSADGVTGPKIAAG
ncbi:MAG: SUMF1/EgtB/PvdO family nonheme iron enzyme, partial [Spirochaetota bacterium]